MNATDIELALQTNDYWIKQAALNFRPNKKGRPYDTATSMFFREVTVRIPATKINKRTGKSYQSLQRRRIDLVALIKPNYRAYELLVCGIEIKVDKHDLLNDTKMDQYTPYCHFSYLAVPLYLEKEALHIPFVNNGFYGVIVVDTDQTIAAIIHPRLVTPTDQHLKEMYSELLVKQFKLTHLAQTLEKLS